MNPIVVGKGHNFDQIKADAKRAIDRKAEEARSPLMTPIFGQDYVYAQKLREAERFLTDTGQDSSQFHFLSAESQVTGDTLKVVAGKIVAAKNVMDIKLARIETIRRQAKAAVDACENKIAVIQKIVSDTNFV
jgi:hypothetical protein